MGIFLLISEQYGYNLYSRDFRSKILSVNNRKRESVTPDLATDIAVIFSRYVGDDLFALMFTPLFSVTIE